MGARFAVNTTTNLNQSHPSLTSLNGGGFLPTWESQEGTEYLPGYDYGIYGQIFNNDSSAVGSEFQISEDPNLIQTGPQAALLSNGNFVITWSAADNMDAPSDIFARGYSPEGDDLGPEFLVNSTHSYDEKHPSITALTGGGFVVSWTGGNHPDIFAQIFDNNGDPVNEEFYLSNTSSLEKNLICWH